MLALAIMGSLAAMPALAKHGRGGGKEEDSGEVSGKDGKDGKGDDSSGSSFDPTSTSGSDDSGGQDHGGSDHGGSDDGGTSDGSGDHGGSDGKGGSDDGGSDGHGGSDSHGGSDDGGSDDHGGHGSDDSGSDSHGGHGSDDGKSDDHGGHGSDDASDGGNEVKSGSDGGSSGDVTSVDHGSETGGDDQLADADKDPIDFDREGFAARGHEVLALAVSAEDLEPLREMGVRIKETERLEGLDLELAHIEVPGDQNPEAALARLAALDGKVAFALNHLYGAGRIAGPPTPVRARAAKPGRATVGMIDGRVFVAALPGTIVEAQDFTTRAVASPDHGTAVAALLADAGAQRIYAANVFSGRTASVDAIARALSWMAARRVSVINISLAGPPNPIVERLIKLMAGRGFAIVAAIGNDGPAAPPLYPAAYADVIAVTAVDAQDHVYRRANRGAWTSFAALGVDVGVTDGKGVGHLVSGTSFAAPVVSVRLAELLDTPDPARRHLAIEALSRSARDLGAPGRDPVFGYGLITATTR